MTHTSKWIYWRKLIQEKVAAEEEEEEKEEEGRKKGVGKLRWDLLGSQKKREEKKTGRKEGERKRSEPYCCRWSFPYCTEVWCSADRLWKGTDWLGRRDGRLHSSFLSLYSPVPSLLSSPSPGSNTWKIQIINRVNIQDKITCCGHLFLSHQMFSIHGAFYCTLSSCGVCNTLWSNVTSHQGLPQPSF